MGHTADEDLLSLGESSMKSTELNISAPFIRNSVPSVMSQSPERLVLINFRTTFGDAVGLFRLRILSLTLRMVLRSADKGPSLGHFRHYRLGQLRRVDVSLPCCDLQIDTQEGEGG